MKFRIIEIEQAISDDSTACVSVIAERYPLDAYSTLKQRASFMVYIDQARGVMPGDIVHINVEFIK